MPIVAADLAFSLVMTTGGSLPRFWGPTIRGAFGFALKKTVCHVSHGQCDRCILRTRCPYPVVFEGVPPPVRDFMRKYPYVPQPFVLSVDKLESQVLAPGDSLQFTLRLLGAAVDLHPYVAFTVLRMGQAGLGRDRARFELASVFDSDTCLFEAGDSGIRPPALRTIRYDQNLAVPCRVRIEFISPVRLKDDGRLSQSATVELIIRSIARRYRTLETFYGSSENSLDLGSAFADAERARIVHSELSWCEVPRFSSRQNRRMSLGGLCGTLVVDLESGHALPWLRLGEELHLGKGTSFGLGRIRCTKEIS